MVILGKEFGSGNSLKKSHQDSFSQKNLNRIKTQEIEKRAEEVSETHENKPAQVTTVQGPHQQFSFPVLEMLLGTKKEKSFSFWLGIQGAKQGLFP